TSSGIILVRLKDLAAMEVLPKSTVVLVLFVLWVPLAFCRNTTSGTVSNETVPPTLSLPPSTPLATPTTTESSTTTGPWFFWRRSVGGNGTVPRAESYVPHNPVNTSTNVTGTPDSESLVTRSSDKSTVEMSSTFATDDQNFVVPSSTEATTTSNSAASTDIIRDRSGIRADMNGSSNTTESTLQRVNDQSTSEAPTTSSAPEDMDATSVGSCPCHDTATPSTSAQPVTIQQQAHVTRSSEDTSSDPSVVRSPTGSHPFRVSQTPAQTSTTTTTRAPDYIV
ncbi:unnamed protein product, partial [Ixodes pacificus]